MGNWVILIEWCGRAVEGTTNATKLAIIIYEGALRLLWVVCCGRAYQIYWWTVIGLLFIYGQLWSRIYLIRKFAQVGKVDWYLIGGFHLYEDLDLGNASKKAQKIYFKNTIIITLKVYILRVL